MEKKMKNGKVKPRNFDCVVKLNRMTKKEIEMYSNSIIIVRNFDLKIRNDYLETGGMKQFSNNRTFTISFKKRMPDLILEQCNSVSKPMLIQREQKKTAAAKAPRTLTQFINSSWIECKKNFQRSVQPIETGDIVMAKMRTFSAWPGKVTSFTKDKKRAHIHFFGTNNIGSVEVNEIVPFRQCQIVIKLLLLRPVSPFHKGILEIEALFNVPTEKSLLNEYKSLL